MFNFRNGVFETNSSSSHSICISPSNKVDTYCLEYYTTTPDNKILVKTATYDCEYDSLRTTDEKLSYLVTMIITSHYDKHSGDHGSGSFTKEQVQEFPEIIELENFIRKFTNYDGLDIIADIEYPEAEFNCWNCEVDHESMFKDYREFLSFFKISLFDYLFNSCYSVLTGGDR